MTPVPPGHLAGGGSLRLAAAVPHAACAGCGKPFVGPRTTDHCPTCRESPERKAAKKLRHRRYMKQWVKAKEKGSK